MYACGTKDCILSRTLGEPAADGSKCWHAHNDESNKCIMPRVFADLQLEAWTQLSGLTHLTLRSSTMDSHRSTLATVVPRLTTLRSLTLMYWWPYAAGEHDTCCPMISSRACSTYIYICWQHNKAKDCTALARIQCPMLQM